jgi:hypothetical protein
MASPVLPIIPTQQLPNAAAALYTSPIGTTTRIDSLSCTNIDTSVHTVTIHLVASGGGAGTANITTKAQPILPGETWNSPNEYGKYLAAGDAIYASADSASVVNIFAGGTQFT